MIALSSYLYLNPEKEIVYEVPPTFCGTESTPPEKVNGKKIFGNDCAACHKMNTKDNIIRNIPERFPHEKYLYSFLTNEDSLIKSKDKFVLKLNDEYSGNHTHNSKLTYAEFKDLINYIK